MRKIIIHCGLHKTGTTALQLALFNNRKKLAAQGYVYPEIGIPKNHHGHHNLAWQLSRDRRFRGHYGDFKSLFSYFEGVGNNIVLSSEDFECSLLHPLRWKKIQEEIESQGLKMVFVIYLRNHINYLESLYAELLKAGAGDEYELFAGRVIANKRYWHNESEFVFDYTGIANSLGGLRNVETVFRNYDNLVDGNVVNDFCDAIGVNCSAFKYSLNVGQINKRPPLDVLLKLFFKNRSGALTGDAADAVDELCEGTGSNLASPAYVRDALNNVRKQCALASSQQLPLPALDLGIKVNIRKIFSLETYLLMLNLPNLKNEPDTKQRLIGEWRKWIQINHA